MTDTVLRVRGLTRRFGGVVAVSDVDLDIAPGERRAVLGPNGAGKSTLFNLIAGADTPTSGSIELFGDGRHPPRRAPAHPDGAVADLPDLAAAHRASPWRTTSTWPPSA